MNSFLQPIFIEKVLLSLLEIQWLGKEFNGYGYRNVRFFVK